MMSTHHHPPPPGSSTRTSAASSSSSNDDNTKNRESTKNQEGVVDSDDDDDIEPTFPDEEDHLSWRSNPEESLSDWTIEIIIVGGSTSSGNYDHYHGVAGSVDNRNKNENEANNEDDVNKVEEKKMADEDAAVAITMSSRPRLSKKNHDDEDVDIITSSSQHPSSSCSSQRDSVGGRGVHGDADGDGVCFHVHKNILAVGSKRCEYFRRLFHHHQQHEQQRQQQYKYDSRSNNSSSSSSSSNTIVGKKNAFSSAAYCVGFSESIEYRSRIEMDEIAYLAFPIMLDYIYSPTDTLDINTHNATALYYLGEYFENRKLRYIAKQFWMNDINITNCDVYYSHAIILSVEKIISSVATICCNNILQIRATCSPLSPPTSPARSTSSSSLSNSPPHGSSLRNTSSSTGTMYSNHSLLKVSDAELWRRVLYSDPGKHSCSKSILVASFFEVCANNSSGNINLTTFRELTHESVLPQIDIRAARKLIELESQLIKDEEENDDEEEICFVNEDQHQQQLQRYVRRGSYHQQHDGSDVTNLQNRCIQSIAENWSDLLVADEDDEDDHDNDSNDINDDDDDEDEDNDGSRESKTNKKHDDIVQFLTNQKSSLLSDLLLRSLRRSKLELDIGVQKLSNVQCKLQQVAEQLEQSQYELAALRQKLGSMEPSLIVVQGAGNNIVNGVYHHDGYSEDACRYVMHGKWNGQCRRFSVSVRDEFFRKHWIISVARFGTTLDFYEVPVTTDSSTQRRIPPKDGWRVSQTATTAAASNIANGNGSGSGSGSGNNNSNNNNNNSQPRSNNVTAASVFEGCEPAPEIYCCYEKQDIPE